MSKQNRAPSLKRGRYGGIKSNELKEEAFQLKVDLGGGHLGANIVDPRVLTVRKAVSVSQSQIQPHIQSISLPTEEQKIRKVKEKAEKEKTKEKESKAKEKERDAKAKEKEAKAKLREKEKAAKAKEKEREKKAKAKEKEREKKAKAKEQEKEKAAKAKEKEREKKARAKEQERIAKVRKLEKKKKEKEKALNNPNLLLAKPIVVPPKFPYFSGYTLFCAESYRNLKETLASPTLEQVNNQTKENAKMWHAMSDDDKLVFDEKAAVINKERSKEIESWWETVDKSLVALENQRRRKVNASRKREGKRRIPLLIDPRLPKKPPSKFMMFVKELSLTNKKEMSESITEFSKNASLKWKQLPDSEKEAYREKYEKAYKEYLENVKKIEDLSPGAKKEL